ncbi:MAG: ligase-associated DNA damage response endonuclease PdeM [Desulfosarcina sp.]
MRGSQTIALKDQQVSLLPQRLVFWHDRNMLILADPHFGKAAAFRRSGLAIPTGTSAHDLQRLYQAIDAVGATRILILGDLMHAPGISSHGLTARIHRWRKKRLDIEWLLVRGNHDRCGDEMIDAFGFQKVVEQLVLGPFTFIHKPEMRSGTYVVSGHLHPAVQLAGPGGQRERLPCFYLGRGHAILPAFGSFTGHAAVRPRGEDRVYAIADERVIIL